MSPRVNLRAMESAVLDQAERPLVTVFTPTYQRAHLLHRVHGSLSVQDFRGFEWLVVDDGSTDDTADRVAGWAESSDFPVRYLHQPNQGKPAATNHAARQARGELFLPFDSDDSCRPEALSTLVSAWLSIPEDERARFAGVACHCLDESGRLVGDPYPAGVVDCSLQEMRYRHGVRGEKWGLVRTQLLLEHPFPTGPDMQHVPEDVVWDAIGRESLTRFLDVGLRIYHSDEGPAGERIMSTPAGRHAAGHELWHRLSLDEDLRWFAHAPLHFLGTAAHFVQFCLHCGIPPWRQPGRLRGSAARLLWAVGFLPGLAAWLRDRLRG